MMVAEVCKALRKDPQAGMELVGHLNAAKSVPQSSVKGLGTLNSNQSGSPPRMIKIIKQTFIDIFYIL